MNAAFLLARSYAWFDCYIFHDVDMLPEDDRNFYTCSDIPRHVGSHISKWKYQSVTVIIISVIRHNHSSASSSTYSYTFLRSVVCRLSHVCTLLKQFDKFRCHLTITLVGSDDTLVPDAQGKGRFQGLNLAAKTCNCRLLLLLPGKYKRAI